MERQAISHSHEQVQPHEASPEAAITETPPSPPAPNTATGRKHESTTAYILESWETLTRSMNDCTSLTDVKVSTHPVLYLPAEFAVPPKVAQLYQSCYVQIRSLPKPIRCMGDVKSEDLPAPGLLYLPNSYVVPGGRFNEMYGWDSYFIVLGLIDSGLHEMARGMVDNALFEVEHYGAVLNANRTYYLTRSQPPFLTCMIRAVYDNPHSFPDQSSAHTWLEAAYKLAAKYYQTWTTPYRKAGNTGLARFYDMDCGPISELADDNHYFHDVIEWLRANPSQDPGYMAHGASEANGAHQSAVDCNPRTGVVRQPAAVDGYRLTNDFYLGDRAMRESGFDSSFRFGPFCGSTHHYAPPCLNSLLVRYEKDMAALAQLLGLEHEVEHWQACADQRSEAIHKWLWSEQQGLFVDYDFMRDQVSRYAYLSAYYPMWAGFATREQAAKLRDNLHLFERHGGLSMSATDSGMQWDEPYGWAPCNWIAIEGLMNYGYEADARRIAHAYVRNIDKHFSTDGTVREKYDVLHGGAEVHVTAGYKENVIGFGWTNGVYLKLKDLLKTKPSEPN